MKLFFQILFYGSLWGLLEATLGYVLHFLPLLIAGSIMFPLASVILYKAYNSMQSKSALFYVGLVAAMIKGINLFLPQVTIFKTINPMISILMESLVVVLVISFLVGPKPIQKYLALPFASVVWRVLFIAWGFFIYFTSGFQSTLISTSSAMIEFVIYGGLLSGAIATALVLISSKISFHVRKIDFHPVLATSLLLVAILATYFL
jgi:hypothetical protein